MSYILEYPEVGGMSLLSLPSDNIKEFVKALERLDARERTRVLEGLLTEVDFVQ